MTKRQLTNKEIDEKLEDILISEGLVTISERKWLKITARNLRRALVSQGIVVLPEEKEDEATDKNWRDRYGTHEE